MTSHLMHVDIVREVPCEINRREKKTMCREIAEFNQNPQCLRTLAGRCTDYSLPFATDYSGVSPLSQFLLEGV